MLDNTPEVSEIITAIMELIAFEVGDPEHIPDTERLVEIQQSIEDLIDRS